MARTIGSTVEILLRRVRQEGGLAVDVDFATKIYAYCEQLTNAVTRRVISSTTLATPKENLVFDFRALITDAIEITSISKSNRELFKCDSLDDFAAFDYDWFRN